MSFTKLDLNEIVVATLFSRAEMGRKVVKGKPPFQVAWIHLLFDV